MKQPVITFAPEGLPDSVIERLRDIAALHPDDLDLEGELVETEIPAEYRWNSDDEDVTDEQRGAAPKTCRLTHVLSIVNAPHARQLTAPELAHALANIETAKRYSGQVSSFFGEVPVESQLAFAAAHGIPAEALKAAAQQFAEWSGESYRL